MRKSFSFGVLADVQYAEADCRDGMDMRGSIVKLADCVAEFNTRDLAFVIQLGDFVNGSEDAKAAEAELDRVLEIFARLKADGRHVLGNHDFFSFDRPAMPAKLGMERAYYDFEKDNWRFVVLDEMDLAISGGWGETSENYRRGREILDGLIKDGAANALEYNGAMGAAQIEWLDGVLGDADERKQNVMVFGHLPLTPAGDKYDLWNSDEVIAVLESHECVVTHMSGHRHPGGYSEQNGIYYVTIEAMVTESPKNAYAVVDVYGDRIEIEGFGLVASRTLSLGI
ncbi:MAG: metallophosphoesterase [Planctomycetes bacterium]|nr:metallophosphoesterase [Planctomycetota bacterium]MCK5174385.1 metallophosphoesterase [Planctomycetota bacterium]